VFGNWLDAAATTGALVVVVGAGGWVDECDGGGGGGLLELDVSSYERLLGRVLEDHPNLALVASTLRQARTATVNDWSAVCRTREAFHVGPGYDALEIFDRVGGGDSFASGLIYGLLEELDVEQALAYGVAHGALAMTTPGDTSMATRVEVERLVAGRAPRVDR